MRSEADPFQEDIRPNKIVTRFSNFMVGPPGHERFRHILPLTLVPTMYSSTCFTLTSREGHHVLCVSHIFLGLGDVNLFFLIHTYLVDGVRLLISMGR